MGMPILYPAMINPLLPPMGLDLYSKYVEAEFKKIVGENNIRRMVFYDRVGNETYLIDRSPNKKNAALSLPASSLGPSTAGKARTLNFNASTKYFEFADADDLSFGNGTADSPMSIVSCLNPDTLANKIVLAKVDGTTGSTNKEYELYFDGNSKLTFQIWDDSTGGSKSRYYNTASTGDVGKFNTYISTYSGNSSETGINLYANGLVVDDATFNNGTYVAMENKGAKVGNYRLETSGAKGRVGSYKGAFMAILSIELTQAQVTQINQLLRRYVGVM
jgi:hypothetical protein